MARCITSQQKQINTAGLDGAEPQKGETVRIAEIMEERVEGWKNISKAFPCPHSTFIRKHAPEMLKTGYAMRSHTIQNGIVRKPMIWSFPSLIIAYISAKQIKNGHV